jgi:uncharacterized protein YrrD
MNQIKATQLLKLPVISVDDGSQAGTVSEVLYNPQHNKVDGLLVSGGGMFSGDKILLSEHISSIGEDAVMVASGESLIEKKDAPEQVQQTVQSNTFLTKTTVLAENGEELGSISDVAFTLPSGTVTQLEVSQGALHDTAQGRAIISPQHIKTIGEDALIVSSYTKHELEQQEATGGVAGMAKSASEKARQVTEQTGEKMQQTREDVTERIQQARENPENQRKAQQLKARGSGAMASIQETMQDAVERGKTIFNRAKQDVQQKAQEISEGTEEATKQQIVGQYLTKNVVSPDDQVVARRGEMLTHRLIERLKSMGLLQQVFRFTSPEPVI